MYGLIIVILVSCILIADVFKLVDITGKYVRIPVCLFLPHFILLWISCNIWGRILLIVDFMYVCIRLHFFPFRHSQIDNFRVNVLFGGQLLIRFSLWGFTCQILYYLGLFFFHDSLSAPWAEFLFPGGKYMVLFWIDAFLTVLFLWGFLVNGALRVLFTCYRLGILRRILIVFNLWIPILNLFLMNYICKKAIEEYYGECCRFENRMERPDNLTCQTKYPIILLHGIGFRDMRYFNYWGRIPKRLVANGATVYYGHQEAWGTIEKNGLIIQQKINEVLALSNCEKVNIIAHSKGGLDARYVISELDMAPAVASLTTVSTPHLGSELITLLNKLPDSLYRFISSLFNKTFQKIGDQTPDCYAASKQLAPEYCREFNERYPDAPEVYYQSYASVMKHSMGDRLLSVPHLLMNLSGAAGNDGLVTETSARWGNFRGTFTSTGRRGISHGDMIDLKREDYKGFDVLEEYIRIVQDLKNRGY